MRPRLRYQTPMAKGIGYGVCLAGVLAVAFSCSSRDRNFNMGAGGGGAGGDGPDASAGTSAGAVAGTHAGSAGAASSVGGASGGDEGGGFTAAGAGEMAGAAGTTGDCQPGETRSCSEDGALGKCATGTETCSADATWGTCSVQPAAKDTCVANNDDNCNGIANEGCPCAIGQSRSCKDAGALGKCASGTQTCTGAGVWGGCSIVPATKDGCVTSTDDETCNGKPNEGCGCVQSTTPTRTCAQAGLVGKCAVAGAIETCSATGTWGACSVVPSAADTCVSGNNDNCSGAANEGCQCINSVTKRSCGTCNTGTQVCTDGKTNTYGTCAGAADTNTDPANCGTCGHSCQGGTCSAGMCQPLLLGTVPSTVDYARATIVSGGKVYVFTQVGQGSPSNVWQTSATTPGTPTEVKVNGTVSCIMNGKLFWTTGTTPDQIDSCTLSNCAATTTPVVTATGDHFAKGPGCDVANNELVWVEPSVGSTGQTIFRASSTGTNARQITSFTFPNDGASWQLWDNSMFTSGIVRRMFYVGIDSTAGSFSLHAITTDVVNAAGIGLLTAKNSQILSSGLLADDSLALVSDYLTSNAYNALSVPLPNGIVSGSAPVFAAGNIFSGVLDSTSFYGTVSNDVDIPDDAIVRCPRSGCTAPTLLVRGQAAANYFAQDATALYWTTNAQTSALGFSIWKMAK